MTSSGRRRLSVILTAAAFLLGCETKSDPNASDGTTRARPLVTTVNEPLRYFAERIGGAHIDVVLPAPSDGDPAFWNPDDASIDTFQSSDLILLNGADYAKWRTYVSLPMARTIDTAAAFRDRFIEVEGGVIHVHGTEGDHSHAGVAFTTWLDPMNAIAHAKAIETAFAARWPEHAADFAAGNAALRADLESLDERFRAAVGGRADRPVLASHPVYQYLARRYDLAVRSVTWEPETLPSDDAWATLDAMLAENPATWMLWEGDPLDETRSRLTERGIAVAVFDPCGNVPAAGDDWLAVMNANAESLVRIYGND